MGSDRGNSQWRTERFFVADRRMGWVVGSLSLTASQVSAGTLVGAVGIHYLFGVSFVTVWLGIWLGWLVSMYYVAPQLRQFGGVTVPEFLGARFDDDGAGGARVQALTATLVALIFLVFTAAQYIAGGVLVETVLGVPPAYGMAAIMGLTLVYTAAGGMRASIATDVLWALLMILGLAVATASTLVTVGGPVELYGEVTATAPSLLGFGMPAEELLSFALAFGLSITVAPYEVSRVYAMESESTVAPAIKASVALQAFIAVCVLVLGLAAAVLVPGLNSPDTAIAELITSQLGPVAGWLLVGGVVAAILSTVDSILLVSASAVAYDLYGMVLQGHGNSRGDGNARPRNDGGVPTRSPRGAGFDDGRTLRVARLVTVAAAVVPFGLALNSGLLGDLVQVVVALYGALVAGTLFAPVLLGIQWDRATTRGAVAGVLAGFVAVAGWHLLWTVYEVVPGPLGLVPPTAAGVVCSTPAVVVVSLLDR